METLTTAYQRLLADLVNDLHASCAIMEVTRAEEQGIETLASYGTLPPSDEGVEWLELPVHEGASEVSRLCLAFARGSALPNPDEPRIAHAISELDALLALSDWQRGLLPATLACRRILAVNEEELQHIILDIHDGPVQKLFAASSQVESMRSRLPNLPEEARSTLETDLARIAALLQESLNEIKNTLGTLRPPEFRRRPLASVLQSLIIQHETLTGMDIDLQVEGELPPVSLPVKIAIYRIMQEALSNAYRHAQVDSLDVKLAGDDGWVTLEVADAGRGFEPPPLEGPSGTEREEHIGLRGMRDRALLVGGQIWLTSRPGEGTRIEVKVPGDV